MISAHGGKLVNRTSKIDPTDLMSVDISTDLANDVENIADGIFSPLEGFLNKQDFDSVVEKGRLENGIAWTIPTVLDVDEETSQKMKDSGDVLLKNPDGIGIAVLHVEDVFTFDKSKAKDDLNFKNILIDKASADLLKGSEVDYVSELIGEQFKITNPQTKSSCGCGVSFSL